MMRKSKEEAAESRRRILTEASRLFREKGFDGVGVADIMEAAGMTHGGFYRHFPSKEALIGEAMAEAFADLASPFGPGDPGLGADHLRGYIDMYLSDGHITHPSRGCPVAAVGSEAAHLGGDVSRTFGQGIARTVERIAASLDGSPEERRSKALRLGATLVGAVVVARAVGPDCTLRAAVLDAVRQDDEIASLLACRQ